MGCGLSLGEEARLIEAEQRLRKVATLLGLTEADIRYVKRFFYTDDILSFITRHGLTPEASLLVQRWFGISNYFATLETFVLCVYDFVTTMPGQMPSLVFQLFDDAKTGELNTKDTALLISSLWRTPSPAVASAMARRGWTVLNEKSWRSMAGQFPELMAQVFTLVELLRAKSWGLRRCNQLRAEREIRFQQQPLGDVLAALPVKPICYHALPVVMRRPQNRRRKPGPAPVPVTAAGVTGKVGAEAGGRRAASESSMATSTAPSSAAPSAAPSRPPSAAWTATVDAAPRAQRNDDEKDDEDLDQFASPVPRKKPVLQDGVTNDRRWKRERRLTR